MLEQSLDELKDIVQKLIIVDSAFMRMTILPEQYR